MNSIPSTSDFDQNPTLADQEYRQSRVNYTIVGGQRGDGNPRGALPLTLLVLNRGGRPFRNNYYRDLEKLGFQEIISVETQVKSYDTEQHSRKYPHIRFILIPDKVSLGSQVNIGIQESRCRFVFVLWNDMSIASGSISSRLVDRVLEEGDLVAVPLMQSSKMQTIPSLFAPAFFKRKLKVISLAPQQDGMPSLFPFDYTGIYNREKFIGLGGFDGGMSNSYWQKLDFGFRAYMWGHRILCRTALRLRYQVENESENTTPDQDYKTFYLKNLLVRFNGDSGALGWGSFYSYYLNSRTGFFTALKEFRYARSWIEAHKFRFKQDARRVTDLWENWDS